MVLSESEQIANHRVLSTRKERWNSLFIFLSVIIAIVPDLNRYLPKPIWIFALLLWYIHTVFFCGTRASKKSSIPLYVAVIYVGFLIEVLLKVVGYSSAELGNYFVKFAFIDLVIKGIYVHKHYSEGGKRILFRLIQVIILLMIAQNIYAGITIPNVHYYMYFYPDKYIGLNVAMTEFYNMLAFFIGASLCDLLNTRKTKTKMFDLFGILLSFFFMFSYEPRTTAIAISLLYIAIVFIVSGRNQTNKLMISLAVVTTFLFIVFFAHDTLLTILPERVSVRLSALLQLSGSRLSYSEYYSRFVLFSTSLGTFLSSPKTLLFGVGLHLGGEYDTIIGQHSFVVDSLAAYGIVGFAYLVAVYSCIKKALVDKGDTSNPGIGRRVALVVLLIALVLSSSVRPELAVTAVLLVCCLTKNV